MKKTRAFVLALVFILPVLAVQAESNIELPRSGGVNREPPAIPGAMKTTEPAQAAETVGTETTNTKTVDAETVGTETGGTETVETETVDAETAGIKEKPLYIITAGNGAGDAVNNIQREMELRFDVYNRLFRFDKSSLSAPLYVRVFGSDEDYDRYVAGQLGTFRPGAIYIHYNQPEKRELVIDLGSPKEASMLAHQAFIQYLCAFIPNPPPWLLEGFALYFSTLNYDSQGNPSYEENLQWLEAVKNLGEKLPSPKEILQIDDSENKPENFDEFQISSWALVSFLLNGGRDYFRDLTDCFMLLSPSADTTENTRVVAQRFSLWNDYDAMEKDFKIYLDSRKSYGDLIEDGRRAYSQGDLMNAELSFMTAMDLRPDEYIPRYYLGLLSYEEKNYDEAEQYYLGCLGKGADEALVNYALGINAAEAGRTTDAAGYLRKAAALDPGKYSARVEELLKKIGN